MIDYTTEPTESIEETKFYTVKLENNTYMHESEITNYSEIIDNLDKENIFKLLTSQKYTSELRFKSLVNWPNKITIVELIKETHPKIDITKNISTINLLDDATSTSDAILKNINTITFSNHNAMIVNKSNIFILNCIDDVMLLHEMFLDCFKSKKNKPHQRARGYPSAPPNPLPEDIKTYTQEDYISYGIAHLLEDIQEKLKNKKLFQTGIDEGIKYIDEQTSNPNYQDKNIIDNEILNECINENLYDIINNYMSYVYVKCFKILIIIIKMIEEGHICYLHEVSIFLYIILKIYNQSISSSKTKNFVVLTIIRPIYSRISEFTENSVIYFFILLTVPHLQQFIDIRNIPTYTLILIPNSRQMEVRQSQWDINNLHPRYVDTRFMTDTAKNIFGKIYAHEGNDEKPENYPINIVHIFYLNYYKL